MKGYEPKRESQSSYLSSNVNKSYGAKVGEYKKESGLGGVGSPVNGTWKALKAGLASTTMTNVVSPK